MQMIQFIDALERCIDSQNWYGALIVALTLPDICARIDQPTENSSQRRYAAWFDAFAGDSYRVKSWNGGPEKTFLSGNDCYALRCALLHEGADNITRQRAREALERFQFLVPPRGTILHNNLVNTKLQLQVEVFSDDIRRAVITWLEATKSDPVKAAACNDLLKIQVSNGSGTFRI